MAEFVDLETKLVAIDGGDIPTIAAAHDVALLRTMAEINPYRQRKRRCQTSPAAPGRRVRVGDVEQQGGQRGLRVGVGAGRQQFIAMITDESRSRFAGRKAGMTQTGNQKSLIGGDAKRRRLLQPADQPAARLVAIGAMADDLGDHEIVERRDLGAGLQRVLDADAIRHLPQRQFCRTAA